MLIAKPCTVSVFFFGARGYLYRRSVSVLAGDLETFVLQFEQHVGIVQSIIEDDHFLYRSAVTAADLEG